MDWGRGAGDARECAVMAGLVLAVHVLLRNIEWLTGTAVKGRIRNARAAANACICAFAVEPAASAIGVSERPAAIGFEGQFAQKVAEPFAYFVFSAFKHLTTSSGS